VVRFRGIKASHGARGAGDSRGMLTRRTSRGARRGRVAGREAGTGRGTYGAARAARGLVFPRRVSRPPGMSGVRGGGGGRGT
jgi:hypothetical protein